MFARIFTVNLKAGEGPGYTQTVQREVEPILRKFAGFRDHIGMVSSDGKQGIGISFWDRPEDADAYARAAYEDVVKCLQEHMDGIPLVRAYNVTNWAGHAVTPLKAGA